MKIKILVVFGTRPEAIKMGPLIKELKLNKDCFKTIVCVTAQHRQMLDSVLSFFDINADYDLNLMTEKQDLWNLTSDIMLKIKNVYDAEKPDLILVHGDTTTAMAASISAFYSKIKIGHVEAGLRTFNKYNPFPEEFNRLTIGNIADFHFSPTKQSANNLKKSLRHKSNIYVTGNTVIDALMDTAKKSNFDFEKYKVSRVLKIILLTMHRRENHGKNINDICIAVKNLVKNNHNIQFVIPVHLNPNVKDAIRNILDGVDRVHLINSLDYGDFVGLMKASYIIMTDSGGIQEEAPSLKKPTLVLRVDTERPEAIKSGAVKLIGTNSIQIQNEVGKLLADHEYYSSMTNNIKNPYGNGNAAKKIVRILKNQIYKK